MDGWNSVVKSMLTGAKTVESAKADLLDGEEVPLVQQPIRKASLSGVFPYSGQPLWRMGGDEEPIGGGKEGNHPLSGVWSAC